MGQLALGFRSLLIKAAIFVVMAALLAWALGGALLPRTLRLTQQSVTLGAEQWSWQLVVREDAELPPHWQLVHDGGGVAEPSDGIDGHWLTVADLIVRDRTLYTAGQLLGPPSRWVLLVIEEGGQPVWHDVPDRLAVEQQLARVRNGLSIQDAAAIHRQRSLVLDPPAADAGEPREPREPTY